MGDQPKKRKRTVPAPKGVKSCLAYAEISEDKPPCIWNVAWYPEQLRADLGHIRVRVTPIRGKARKP